MNDRARDLMTRIARTALGVVRAMQPPDDLPPKTGEKREAKVEEKPERTAEVTISSRADWRTTVSIELTDERSGTRRMVDIPIEESERVTMILQPVPGANGKLSIGTAK